MTEPKAREIPRCKWMRLAVDIAKETCMTRGVTFRAITEHGIWFDTAAGSTGIIPWDSVEGKPS